MKVPSELVQSFRRLSETNRPTDKDLQNWFFVTSTVILHADISIYLYLYRYSDFCLNKTNIESEVGHDYYDWLDSDYRWMDALAMLQQTSIALSFFAIGQYIFSCRKIVNIQPFHEKHR